jgi:hypothetical protein
MQYETSVWSSKVDVETAPSVLTPEKEPLQDSSQYEFEQFPPGSYVYNKVTGRVGVVYGERFVPGQETSGGLIVKYLEGAEDSYGDEGFFIDEDFDDKGVRRGELGLSSASGYNDIRYYTFKITSPANLENVTEDFITPGTNGILLGDTMFGIIKNTNKRGKIVGFPARGALTIAVANSDGSHSFEKIPISDFLPIQSERPSVIPGKVAYHSGDMLPTKTDLDKIFVSATTLWNFGYLSERVYRAITESVRGKFLTKAGTRELVEYLAKFDALRILKISGEKAKKIAPGKKRAANQSIEDTQPGQVAPVPENIGNMTLNQFVDYLNGTKVPASGPQFMRFPNGEENTSPTVETRVTVNPPTVNDIRTVQDIIQEPGVISDQDAKNYWDMLPGLDAELLGVLKNRLLTALLKKRMANDEPVAGIEIPANFDKSKLEGYVPKNNLDGTPVQVPTDMEREETEKDIQELSAEQQAVFNHVETSNSSMFITGKAGTGKSRLFNFIRDNSEKNVAAAAPTGAAAENVGAVTIHSLFGLTPGVVYGLSDVEKLLPKPGKYRDKVESVLKAMDTLLVDEMSMVSADLLDAMDRVLRYVKGKAFVPFGGVQFIGFGDVYQLPPVVDKEDQKAISYNRNNYRSEFFFDARAWMDKPLEVYELTQVFRQSDPEFKKVLNNIRVGRFSMDDIEFLNATGSRTVPESVDDLIYATARTKRAQEINQKEMRKLGNAEARTYSGEFNGAGAKAFGKNLPSPVQLDLKVGARVMFTRNDSEKNAKDVSDNESGQGVPPTRRWVNGTIGTVVALGENFVRVKVGDNIYDVGAEKWEKKGYNVNSRVDAISNQVRNKLSPITEATFTQIPLMLAWAATIHKLQGKTIKNLKVDLGEDGAFAPGQLYTAISRVTSPEGLYLEYPATVDDVIVDRNAQRFGNLLSKPEKPTDSRPSLMKFGGEPFDPADPNLDLDKELNYDFTSGPYGIPLLDYQEEMMQIYADMIAQAEKQFGSNSNRVKELKSTRREHYGSYFARPEKREDNIMDKATESLKIDLEGSVTEEYDNPNYRDFKTTTTASYKDRYGRQYRFEGVVSLQELYYGEPGKIQTYIEVKAYDLAGNTDEAVASMSTEWGDIQDGPLLDNQVYIANIETKEEYQRRYLATGLLAFANQLTDKKILHSDKLTKKGYAFMSSVEMDEDRKTIDYPSLAESQDERDKIMVIDITKLSKTKSSAEITDLLQRLNADQISYKLTY